MNSSFEPNHPVQLRVEPATDQRNRLTTAFRLILALPHLVLVGGPPAATLPRTWSADGGGRSEWTAGGGVLGAVAAVVAIISTPRPRRRSHRRPPRPTSSRAVRTAAASWTGCSWAASPQPGA
ncbi:MAG: hypothetical protein ACYC2G_05120 [Gemmatimonadaceae bacterium]